jgi:hypothetical protein
MLTPNASLPNLNEREQPRRLRAMSLFPDGSVHFLKNSVSMQIVWALGSRAHGEVISSDSY